MRELRRSIFLVMLAFIFLWCLPSLTFADGQCDNGPTVTENVVKDPSWPEGIQILTEADAVCVNDYVEALIDSGFGCAPYIWTISGTGFHFNNIAGPQEATTYADADDLLIWADDTATGPCELTVYDACRNEAQFSLRFGTMQWVLTQELDPQAWDGIYVATAEEGDYRYEEDWCGAPCETNCLGDPYRLGGSPHTLAPSGATCRVESARIYTWECN